MTIDWDEDNASFSDGESSDENENDDDDNDDDDNDSDNNDGVDETEGEPGAAAEELYVEDDDELSLIDDDNDFSVAISDMDSTDSEATENDGLRSASYKIVGDNIDKNITPSFQRLDHQTKSVHYFHAFAVKDRIDFQIQFLTMYR